MKKILIKIILFIFYSFPSVGEWTNVMKSKDGDVFYIDYTRIIKIDGYLHYWTLVNYSKRDEWGDMSEINYRKIDCKNLRFLPLGGTFYSLPMGKGDGRTNNKEYDWEFVYPNTVHESILKLVCKSY